MQRRRVGTTGLFALMAGGIMLLAASQTQAQTTGNGPYYAIPSWDQTLPAATRFVILSNFKSEAVLDRNTGLVWEKSPGTKLQTWFEACLICAAKMTGNQMGWRLPSFAELSTLMDPTVPSPGPMLPPGHPFIVATLQPFYWSATTSAEQPTQAWLVLFHSGSVTPFLKTFSNNVWCVRGGGPLSEYRFVFVLAAIGSAGG